MLNKGYLRFFQNIDPFVLIQLVFKYLHWWATYGRKFKQDRHEAVSISSEFLLREDIVHFGNQYILHSVFPPIPSKAFDNAMFPAVQRHLRLDKPLFPSWADVSLTYNCPLRCWHCSAEGHVHPKTDLSTKQWIHILAQLQSAGVYYIALTGGEPLIRDDLEEIVTSINSRSVVALATSGVGLSLERAKRLREAGLYYILVSLDHPIPAVYDRMRGRQGAYQSAIDALNFSHQAGLYTILQCVVTKEFVQQQTLFELVEIGKDLKVQEIRLRGVVPAGRLFSKDIATFLTDEDRKVLMADFAFFRKKPGYPKISLFEDFEHSERLGCNAGAMHTYIDSAGNVCPCDFVPLPFGNLLEEPFSEIWPRVRASLGNPRNQCLASYITIQTKDKNLNIPNLSTNEITELCNQYQHDTVRPGAYT
jgi:MoaA/NifB/PqqE/SkfB family radical SAM enzyme